MGSGNSSIEKYPFLQKAMEIMKSSFLAQEVDPVRLFIAEGVVEYNTMQHSGFKYSCINPSCKKEVTLESEMVYLSIKGKGSWLWCSESCFTDSLNKRSVKA